MEHRFDRLAKSVSGAISRRQALSRFGGGVLLGVLAFFGIGSSKASDCVQFCKVCCENQNIPPRNDDPFGEGYGECISLCHKGEGVCGPLVCPDGVNG